LLRTALFSKKRAQVQQPDLANLEESLRRHGVQDEVIAAVLGETAYRTADIALGSGAG
jgi:hypothetical protein